MSMGHQMGAGAARLASAFQPIRDSSRLDLPRLISGPSLRAWRERATRSAARSLRLICA